MPFVTKNSSLRLNSDIKHAKRDFQTGEITEPGNGLKEVVLTSCDHLSFKAESTDFREIVWRGQPDPVKLCWNNGMPVFRVLTHKFNSDSDWERFMAEYKIERSGLKPRSIHYEPDIQDIRRERADNDFAFPLWVIEQLVEYGEFEAALEEAKVDIPKQKKLTKIQYEGIMEEIEKRREEEEGVKPTKAEPIGNISRHFKLGQS
jgi:hypothetical protein